MSIRSGVSNGPLPLPGGSVDGSRSRGVGATDIGGMPIHFSEDLPIQNGHADVISHSPFFQDMSGDENCRPPVLFPGLEAGRSLRYRPEEGGLTVFATNFNTYKSV